MRALLIAGHGSADPVGAREFLSFVQRVEKRLAPRGVTVAGGFIELAPPPLGDAIDALVAGGYRRFAAVPLMLVAAGHAKADIPAFLDHGRLRHPDLDVAYGRPLGTHPVILDLLRRRLSEVPGPIEETTVLLVGRGSMDPDANSDVAKLARLFAESTEVRGVEYAFISLAPPGVPEALDRCRALGAKRIVVVPYFLFSGILPDRVVAQAREWTQRNDDVEVHCARVMGDTDELAGLVIERFEEAVAGEARMNCDSCVHRLGSHHHHA